MIPITESMIFGISLNSIFDFKIIKKLEESSRALGAINQISSNIFEYDFIIETLKNIESLASARIEGTTGNLQDLYQEDDLKYEQKRELKLFSALNYRSTINELESILKRYGHVDLQVIRHLHQNLAEKDPATHGQAGQFRTIDVKIRNSKLGDFFPPPSLKVPELMEIFFKNELSETPDLIKIAIEHYQFEAIHPFEDGNGRTGRLLMIAKLLEFGIIKTPILNLSQYFEDNRDEYISCLRAVTDRLDYSPWINFFLDAVKIQCNSNIELIIKLRNMKEGDEKMIMQNIKMSSTALHILDFSLNHLFISIHDAAEHLVILGLPIKDSYQAARYNIHALEKLGILTPHHKRGKAVVYAHQKLKQMIIK